MTIWYATASFDGGGSMTTDAVQMIEFVYIDPVTHLTVETLVPIDTPNSVLDAMITGASMTTTTTVIPDTPIPSASVPEPASLLLMASAVAALLLLRRTPAMRIIGANASAISRGC